MKTYPTFITKPLNWAREFTTRDPGWTFTEELEYAVGFIMERRFNSLPDDMQEWGKRALAEKLYELTREGHE